VLGLLLGTVDSPPLVILAYYGLLFAVATFFLGLEQRTLLAMAAVAAIVTPLASYGLRQYVDPAPVEEPGGSDLLVELFLTGTYPVLTWTTYLLAGMAAGRTDLRRWRGAFRLVVGGVVFAVAARVVSSWLLDAAGGVERLPGVRSAVEDTLARGMFGTTPRDEWRWLTVDAPHSGTTLDLAHTVGTSLAVLGGCLLLAKVLPRVALVPFAAAGSMTLTLYSVHVLALSKDSPVLHDDRSELWLAHVAVALVLATLWRTTIGRGPLEALAARLDRTARNSVSGRRRAESSRL
ncbi:MAG: heparan-alpha-glucosaminide N-acetyltransferase domain-containing protein, partial [Actinomycetes bacterium]